MIETTTIVWEMPIPSTALLKGITFEKLLGRTCALTFEYENDDDITQTRLVFEKVEAFKCTYQSACTVEMVETAYDKIIDVNQSRWLTDVKTQLNSLRRESSKLRHLMIYFDDGPCYEFVCATFRAETLE